MAATLTAFWLGILTSVSPCPLATNLAAISYLNRHGSLRSVLAAGLLYSVGRMLAYALLAYALVASVLASSSVSFFLQKHFHLYLGPLLILVGMVLLDLITIPLPSTGRAAKIGQRIGNAGLGGALPLGLLFALTFCPVSAALYFGSLLPLAIEARSSLWLPSVYGFGTALPVLAAAIALSFGAKAAGRFFDRVTAADRWLRVASGAAIVLIGAFLCLKDIFGVFG